MAVKEPVTESLEEYAFNFRQLEPISKVSEIVYKW